MKVVEYLLDVAGIGRNRVALRWVSAAEGQLFAQYVTQFSEETRQLGPFDPERYAMQLAAVENALSSPRIRWLMGMQIQLTQKGNVYQQNLNEDAYEQLLKEAVQEDYQAALILEALREGPRSVRDIAFETGLPVHTVSVRLGDLERRRQAEFKEYDGQVPLFVRAAA